MKIKQQSRLTDSSTRPLPLEGVFEDLCTERIGGNEVCTVRVRTYVHTISAYITQTSMECDDVLA